MRLRGPTSNKGRAYAGTLATNAVLLAIGVISGSVSARLLGPSGRGSLAAILFWPNLLAAVGLVGLPEAVTYSVGRWTMQESSTAAVGFAGAAITGVATMTVSILALPLLIGGDRSSLWYPAILYSLIYIPFNHITVTLLARWQGKLQFGDYNVPRMVSPALYLAGLLILWRFHALTPTSAALAAAIGTALVCFLVLLPNRDLLREAVPWHRLRHMFARGSTFHAATLLMLLSEHADRLIVIVLFGDREVGLYVVAATLAFAATDMLGRSLDMVSFPQLANEKSEASARDSLSAVLAGGILLIGGASLGLGFVSPLIVTVLFGGAYREAIPLLQLMLPGFCLLAIKRLLVRTIRGRGNAKSGALAEVISLLSFLAASVPLSKVYGVRGIAASVTVGSIFPVIYLILQFRKQYGLSGRSLLRAFGTLWDGAAMLLARYDGGSSPR